MWFVYPLLAVMALLQRGVRTRVGGGAPEPGRGRGPGDRQRALRLAVGHDARGRRRGGRRGDRGVRPRHGLRHRRRVVRGVGVVHRAASTGRSRRRAARRARRDPLGRRREGDASATRGGTIGCWRSSRSSSAGASPAGVLVLIPRARARTVPRRRASGSGCSWPRAAWARWSGRSSGGPRSGPRDRRLFLRDRHRARPCSASATRCSASCPACCSRCRRSRSRTPGGGAQWMLSSYGLQKIVPDHIRGRIFAFDGDARHAHVRHVEPC